MGGRKRRRGRATARRAAEGPWLFMLPTWLCAGESTNRVIVWAQGVLRPQDLIFLELKGLLKTPYFPFFFSKLLLPRDPSSKNDFPPIKLLAAGSRCVCVRACISVWRTPYLHVSIEQTLSLSSFLLIRIPPFRKSGRELPRAASEWAKAVWLGSFFFFFFPCRSSEGPVY